MSEFKQSENLTPRQKRMIEAFGNKPVKKIKEVPKLQVVEPKQEEVKPAQLLTISEVADIFRVVPLTIKRWGKLGKLNAIRINSRGDRRYLRSEIEKILGGTK